MKRLANWSLQHFQKADELAVRLRAEVIYRFSILFVFIVLAVLSLSFLVPTANASRVTLLLSLGLFTLPIVLLRRFTSTQPAAVVFVGTLFVSLSIYVVASGVPTHPTLPIWFLSLVIITDLLLGRRWSVGLTLATCGVFGLTYLGFQAGWGIQEGVRGDILIDIWFTYILFGMNLWAVLHILKQHHLMHKQLQEETQAQNQQVASLLEEQKFLNTELRESNLQAQDAVVAKAQFLSTMSHEIRTPMNAVIGMTSLLQETPLSPEQKSFVETVRLSGENLLGIINDILDFSKIEAEKMDLEAHPFPLVQVVEEALDLLSGKATDEGLELMYVIEAEVPAVVAADITRIRQVLVNLINNAIKFTETGEILIQVASRGTQAEKQVIEFEVRDTGIGIPQAKQERLFQSFSQVDATTTRKYGGTGLGLVISKRLIELMGGKIWVESEPGQGSSFFFTIHAAAVDDYPAPSSTPPPMLGSGQKILIVDDNQTNRKILHAQTRQWGFTPILSVSAAEAALALEANPDIQLVILDCQMPEKDGLTFAREVRQTWPLTTLPILMLTSLGMALSQADRLFINGYLHKPAKAAQLQAKISELLAPPLFPPQLFEKQQVKGRFEAEVISLLVVEDNLINQKVALQMLKKIGLNADVAGDGRQAIVALEKKSYDLIFMDMQMPVMDGITATKVIRSRKADWGEPVIIAMTANAFSGDREACLEAGMNDYLSKPVRLEDLETKLIQWLEPSPEKDPA